MAKSPTVRGEIGRVIYSLMLMRRTPANTAWGVSEMMRATGAGRGAVLGWLTGTRPDNDDFRDALEEVIGVGWDVIRRAVQAGDISNISPVYRPLVGLEDIYDHRATLRALDVVHGIIGSTERGMRSSAQLVEKAPRKKRENGDGPR